MGAGAGVEPPDARQGQGGLFDVWRYHAFFTTNDLDAVSADRLHRRHAVIEAVNADLKGSALAHLPSGKYVANAAWLTLAAVAFDLSRAGGLLAGAVGKERSGKIRLSLINVAAWIARAASPVHAGSTDVVAVGVVTVAH